MFLRARDRLGVGGRGRTTGTENDAEMEGSDGRGVRADWCEERCGRLFDATYWKLGSGLPDRMCWIRETKTVSLTKMPRRWNRNAFYPSFYYLILPQQATIMRDIEKK